MADLFAFGDADFQPIAGFGLLCRWTSASHAELPQDVLDRIRPIAPAKAAATSVSEWLSALPVRADEDVVVSWDKDTAVVAPFAVVAAYWSDFFYPGSDDAVVLPPNLGWILAWDHHEAFEFGLPR